MRNYFDYNKLCPTIKGQIYSNDTNIMPIIVSYKNNKKMKEGKISSKLVVKISIVISHGLFKIKIKKP